MRVPIEIETSAMRAALSAARLNLVEGRRPFGAAIVLRSEIVVAVPDQVERLDDPTAHAESFAIRKFASQFGRGLLREAVLYSTVEPCPMCSGALYYAGVRGLVYSVGRRRFDVMVAQQRDRPPKKYVSCRTILDDGGKTSVFGPVLESDGLEVLSLYDFGRSVMSA